MKTKKYWSITRIVNLNQRTNNLKKRNRHQSQLKNPENPYRQNIHLWQNQSHPKFQQLFMSLHQQRDGWPVNSNNQKDLRTSTMMTNNHKGNNNQKLSFQKKTRRRKNKSRKNNHPQRPVSRNNKHQSQRKRRNKLRNKKSNPKSKGPLIHPIWIPKSNFNWKIKNLRNL